MAARLLVADSAAIFRSGVQSALERSGGFTVEQAASQHELLDVLTRRQIDCVLLDLHLEPFGAVAAIQQLDSAHRPVVIVWALDPAPEQVLAVLSAGANGFLTKDMSIEDVVQEVHSALDGEAAICRTLLTGVIGAFQRMERRERYTDRAVKLSARELQVLALISSGTRNREIAELLTISEFTVKRHVQNILHKLNVTSRQAAAHVYRTLFESENDVIRAVPV